MPIVRHGLARSSFSRIQQSRLGRNSLLLYRVSGWYVRTVIPDAESHIPLIPTSVPIHTRPPLPSLDMSLSLVEALPASQAHTTCRKMSPMPRSPYMKLVRGLADGCLPKEFR